MKTRVKDLTVMELQNVIADAVKASMEEVLEDIGAFSSKEYLHSIKKARRDYKEGRVKQCEEAINEP
ncbi:MAG: hypothetical protein PVF58_20980 [Candidatus Methanofastidiosia archaeon]|jgi:hypothetical protein